MRAIEAAPHEKCLGFSGFCDSTLAAIEPSIAAFGTIGTIEKNVSKYGRKNAAPSVNYAAPNRFFAFQARDVGVFTGRPSIRMPLDGSFLSKHRRDPASRVFRVEKVQQSRTLDARPVGVIGPWTGFYS